jgi:dolichol-phosphate mannosyltransferase
MSNNVKKLSFVIPVYNEEENLINTYKAINEFMLAYGDKYEYEIIFTDNHSQDKTFSIVKNIAKDDKRVKAVRFSKNFGYQKSIYTGYLLASGDAAIQLDCDLQDPLQVVREFIKKWEEGYAVVYGIRKNRKEFWLMTLTRKIFYRLIAFFSTDELPQDAGDFRLVDKKIIEELRKLYDYYPYIRGLIASIGFEQIGVPYGRHERKKGKSKFKLTDCINLAIDGMINHSTVPLRLVTYVGLFVFLLGFIAASCYLIGKLFFRQDWPRGFATIAIFLSMTLSLPTIILGIIGEYVGRIYQQVKKRPIVIIDERVNLN